MKVDTTGPGWRPCFRLIGCRVYSCPSSRGSNRAKAKKLFRRRLHKLIAYASKKRNRLFAS